MVLLIYILGMEEVMNQYLCCSLATIRGPSRRRQAKGQGSTRMCTFSPASSLNRHNKKVILDRKPRSLYEQNK